ISVNIIVNSAPISHDDSYTTAEDTPLTVAVPGVLINDGDLNHDPITAALVGQQPPHGTVNLNANGSFTYTPNANFNGTDTFRYQATDGVSSGIPVTVT